jgi:ATP-dependent exoDNAse (exonuclease V) beta subunit
VPAEPTLLEDDTAAREEALDPAKSFIVQAPAGSGKTGLLIQRFLCLLATVDNPEEVLAITFTRKAAHEMRLRVINALRSAAAGDQADTPHERRTLELASRVLARDEASGWQLTQSPSRMRIETVDAFSAGIARSLPLTSGLGSIGSTVADAEMATLYQQAAAATLDYLADRGAAGDAVERILGHLDNNSALYVNYVSRMLASREQWLGITGGGRGQDEGMADVREKLESNIADVIERQLILVASLLPPVCRQELPGLLSYAGKNLLEDGKADHVLSIFSERTSLPRPRVNERLAWRGIADLLLTQKGDWRKTVTKNLGFPAGKKEMKLRLTDMLEAIGDLHDLRENLEAVRSLPNPHYRDDQWQVLLALFDLLPLAVAELHRLFAERGICDHNEVALAAGRALGTGEEPGDAALLLDYRIRHLLIDEMQDTSIGQYDLLKKLTAGWTPDDGRTIFCVGDPMQSIYRFRDAEVGEFLQARRKGIGSVRLEPLTLRQNFRSGERLVHWFNTVFLQVMPLRDDIATGAISYAESIPVAARAGQGEHFVHALFDADAGAEAKHTLGIVTQCLRDNEGDDVVVLVRSRTQVANLLHRLREAKVDYQAVEIDRLTDLPEIIDILALTRALAHEADRLAWLALLRGAWCGMHWADIHKLVVNDVAATVLELCADEQRRAAISADGLARLDGLIDRVRPFLARQPGLSFRERVELAWCALGGPAFLQDDEQIENVARYLDTLDRIAVAGTLDDFCELENRLDAERVSGSGSADCRLQIMTMHKAKGLQFDHVILHGLGRTTRSTSREVLSWLNLPDRDGRSEMLISPVGPRAELEDDPLHQYIEATEKEKSRMELDRLLYVACTRAKKSLHLVGSTGVSGDGESPSKPNAASLLSRLWPALEAEYQQAFHAGEMQETRQAKEGHGHLVLPVLRRYVEAWRVPEPEGWPDSVRATSPDIVDSDQPIEFDWVGARTRHTGTIVHRWLQRIGTGQVSVSVENLDDLDSVTRRWAAGLGVVDVDIDSVCVLTKDALRGILTDEKGCWVLDGPGDCELAVTGVIDGRMESVIMDRIRIDDDGTHWIVDYKTSTHAGGDLPGFLEQEVGRYRQQLAKYATIYSLLTNATVRTALYFPLLQEFREVDVGKMPRD